MSKKTYTSPKMILGDLIAAHDKYMLSLYKRDNEDLINHAGEIYAEKRVSDYLIQGIDYSEGSRNRIVNFLLGKPRLGWADYMSIVSDFARIMVDPDLIEEGGIDDVLEDVVNERDGIDEDEENEEDEEE